MATRRGAATVVRARRHAGVAPAKAGVMYRIRYRAIAIDIDIDWYQMARAGRPGLELSRSSRRDHDWAHVHGITSAGPRSWSRSIASNKKETRVRVLAR